MDERSLGSETDPVRSGKPLGQALEAGGIRSNAAVLALSRARTAADYTDRLVDVLKGGLRRDGRPTRKR